MDDPVAPRPLVTPSRRRALATSFHDLTLAELEAWLAERGYPAYRARQLFTGVYEQLVEDYHDLTTLPRALREQLTAELPLTTLTVVRELTADAGDTIKTLYPDRATVCVSCQVGCAVGCAFCATGLGGLTRNLTAGEMVAQAVRAARRARELGRVLTNLVMMGMGEPLQNYAATMKFIGILHEPRGFNFGARRMTISTAGVVPNIDKLAEEPYQVNLAVSLHAPNDDLRGQLVPLNKRWPIADLLAATDRYSARTGRRVSFEYALMRGINDSDDIARELGALLRGRLCHVNVIPLNPVDVLPYERPDPAGIDRFADILRAAGVPTTVRYSRGLDIDAACGQLRAKEARQERETERGAAGNA